MEWETTSQIILILFVAGWVIEEIVKAWKKD